MKNMTSAVALLAAMSSSAYAGGLDRSNQSIGIIFEQGDYAEFSFGLVSPDVEGADSVGPSVGASTGDMALGFGQIGLGYKKQFTDELSLAITIDQPYGTDITYGPGSTMLAGTQAVLDTTSLNATGRYQFGGGFSVHGGLRAQQLSGNVTLNGAGFAGAGLAGYNVDFDDSIDLGYHIGGAYERPDIALRVALTYYSEITHNLDTRENAVPGVVSQTEVTTPEAINLDFQSGVSANTLVFGSIRYVDWSSVQVTPSVLAPSGASLVNIEDTTTYTLGVGRKFTDAFSGAVSITYEDEGNPNVSPLGPTTGRLGLTVGGSYTAGNMKITGGVSYSKLGDAVATIGGPSGVGVANFNDSSVIGIGFKVGYSF